MTAAQLSNLESLLFHEWHAGKRESANEQDDAMD